MAAVCVVAAAAPTVAAEDDRGDRAARAEPRLARVDQDGDRVEDALELRLRHQAEAQPIPVIVIHDGTITGPGLGAVTGPLPGTGALRSIPALATSMRPAQVRAASRLPGVVRIQLDATVRSTMDAADTDFGTQAARDRLGLTGDGVGICILDSGLARSHEQFAGSDRAYAWRDFVKGSTTFYDDNGHGTHVASIAAGDGVGGSKAARYGGVAPRADVVIGKVLSSNGTATESRVIEALEWCASRSDVDVVNMSLGNPLPSDGMDALSLAADAVEGHGIVVVASAGNGGDLPLGIGAPAAAAGSIAVGAAAEWSAPTGAANRSDGLYLAPFSTRGPTLDGRIKPDVVGPGVTITAARKGSVEGYTTLSGTSMAAPFVAGTIALALQAQPGWTPDDVRAAIAATAVDLGAPGTDPEWGLGALDGYALVALAAGQPAPGAMPAHGTIQGSVGATDVFRYDVDLPSDALGVPLTATVTIDGACRDPDPTVATGCRDAAWDPDLVARMLDPSGAVIEVSDCPSTTGCRRGRQETLDVVPAVAGTYTIEVAAAAGGNGGSFRLDVAHGPLSLLPPAPSRPLHVGDLDGKGIDKTSTTWRSRATIVVHGSDERVVPGAVVRGTWNGTFAGSCTTGSKGTCSLGRNWNRSIASATFTVIDVTLPGWAFDAGASHDVDGGTDGSVVTVSQP
ncbi:MAG TPA: S8 family serine peptidase [Actinomycetota bacterium]|nr:S8 family serine peptidase [Actinomycetota bacterium]